MPARRVPKVSYINAEIAFHCATVKSGLNKKKTIGIHASK
jgi:hypothetical protein